VGEGVQGFSGGRSTGIGLDGLQAVVPLAGTQVNRLVVVPCQKKAKKIATSFLILEMANKKNRLSKRGVATHNPI